MEKAAAAKDRIASLKENYTDSTALYAANIINDLMRANGVSFRTGGSLAAIVKGASRKPEDVDIEVEDGENVERAKAAVQSLHNREFDMNTQDHHGLQVTVLYHTPNTLAKLKVSIIFPRQPNRSYFFEVDIVNENNPTFNRFLVAPKDRGEKEHSGALLSREELIVNYLDRIINKPDIARKKGDSEQIKALIGSKNILNADDYDNLSQKVKRLVKPEYHGMFDEVFKSLAVTVSNWDSMNIDDDMDLT